MRFRRLGALASMLILFAGFVKAGEDTGEEVLDAVRLFRSHHEVEILSELATLVSLPNIATNLDDMERNAEYLTGLLEARRFDVKLLRAESGPPVV